MTDPQVDRGPWIQTYTGRKFYPLDPQPGDIHIEDIAHALANLCRFTGHCRTFYSVAQHSVFVSDLVQERYERDGLGGLLHDASEAYIADVARPIKYLPLMEPYRTYEKKLQGIILERFGLPPTIPATVRTVDNIALMVEAHNLLDPLLPGWEGEEVWANLTIKPRLGPAWLPAVAEHMFLTRFKALTH